MLLTEIENNRTNFVCILAGYEDKMQELLAVDPGLARRFSRKLVLPDYSALQLSQIAKSTAEQSNFSFPAALVQLLADQIQAVHASAIPVANGGLAIELTEKAIQSLMVRCMEEQIPYDSAARTLCARDFGIVSAPTSSEMILEAFQRLCATSQFEQGSNTLLSNRNTLLNLPGPQASDSALLIDNSMTQGNSTAIVEETCVIVDPVRQERMTRIRNRAVSPATGHLVEGVGPMFGEPVQCSSDCGCAADATEEFGAEAEVTLSDSEDEEVEIELENVAELDAKKKKKPKAKCDQRDQQALKRSGPCVAGFDWDRRTGDLFASPCDKCGKRPSSGGYQCKGGTHWICMSCVRKL